MENLIGWFVCLYTPNDVSADVFRERSTGSFTAGR
jgi:hypothetical protein